MWKAPATEEFITFGERHIEAHAMDPWIRDFETVEEAQWKKFRHGLVIESLGSQRGAPGDPTEEDGPCTDEMQEEETAV
eukprot:112211-Lingulodinium_polyedra.AAC.1